MVTANLTPGGRLAEYSDGEIFRTLRHGVDREGRLLGFMSLLPYSRLSDADVAARLADEDLAALYLYLTAPVP